MPVDTLSPNTDTVPSRPRLPESRVVGYIVLARGRKQMSADSMVPERTVQSLQRDARLAKEHVQ